MIKSVRSMNGKKILPVVICYPFLLMGLLYVPFGVAAQTGEIPQSDQSGTGDASGSLQPLDSSIPRDSASGGVVTPSSDPSSTPQGGTAGTSTTGTGTPVVPTNAALPRSTSPSASAVPIVSAPLPQNSEDLSADMSPDASNQLPIDVEMIPGGAEGGSILLVLIIAFFLVSLPLGYLVLGLRMRKKEKSENENSSRCVDIKKLLDEKLRELTDLKGRLKGKIEEKGRDMLREEVRGTPLEGTLALIEKAEKEYGRLTKLYEECMIECDAKIFKGTIIENSLNEKSVLDGLTIEKTSTIDGEVLHSVLVEESQIDKLQKSIAPGPWYIHLWQPGRDDVRILFRDKTFTIKYSDRGTWADAVAHGKALGIPDEELDFLINTKKGGQ